jgi:hypothetical protein
MAEAVRTPSNIASARGSFYPKRRYPRLHSRMHNNLGRRPSSFKPRKGVRIINLLFRLSIAARVAYASISALILLYIAVRVPVTRPVTLRP